MQVRAVDVSTGESGTAALSVLVLPRECFPLWLLLLLSVIVIQRSHCISMHFNAAPLFSITAVGVQSPSEGYRAGDMALLGFVMAALLVLCLIVIGYLISRLKKRNPDTLKLSEVSIFSSSLCESSSECFFYRDNGI